MLEVSGGSHEIATSITDLFSTNFRSGLVNWLKSIPHFTKPFDMMFEPLGTLLSRFSVEMIDESIHKSCIVDKDNFYLHKTIQECFPTDEKPNISTKLE